jgi:hypothetical protein
MSKNTIVELVKKISLNYTKIITREKIKRYPELDWGNNGIGDRWGKRKFNYTLIYYNKKVKTYSENIDDKIDEKILNKFIKKQNVTCKGVIGIFIHSVKSHNISHPISKYIDYKIKKQNCVSCGSSTDIICDHKNDLYNDTEVLDIKTQTISDFQPLCNHCNLLKRQIHKNEKKQNKLFSAKNLQKYNILPFEFPWEKYFFNVIDKNIKKDTYWYDPIEFNNKIYKYIMFTLPIINQIKLLKKRHSKKFI